MKKVIIILAVFLLLPIYANADSGKTGFQLYDNCKNTNDASWQLVCLNYISGYRDGLEMGESIMQLKNGAKSKKITNDYNSHCIPQDTAITNGQMLLIFNKYAEKHPEKLHEPAAILLSLSLIDTFCK